MTDKIYLKNPYLTECNAVIANVIKKNNEVHISFDKTIFYPDLICGQPRDFGTIDDMEVLHVYLKDDNIYHVLKKTPNKKNVRMQIDWNHRWDLMQQHGGQHLLTFAFKNIFNASISGFRIGSEYSTLDISLEALSEEMIDKIEDYVNKITLSCFDFKTYLPQNSSEQNSVPSKKTDEESNSLELDCGTHVRNTGEIGLIKIKGWERLKIGIRIEFLAGFRALRDYCEKSKSLKNIALIFGTRASEVEKKAENLVTQKKELEELNQKLTDTNIKFCANEFISGKRKIGIIDYISYSFENADINDYNRVAKKMINDNPNLLIMLYSNKPTTFEFLIACSADLTIDYLSIFSILEKKFSLKYGGNPHFVQGVLSTEKANDFINELNSMTMKKLNVIL